MKKLLLSLLFSWLLLLCTSQVNAQPAKTQPKEKTRRFLLKYMAEIDSSQGDSKEVILRGIEMVANATVTDWISQYHAAFYNAVIGVNKKDTAMANKMFDKAASYIKRADSLQKDESEIVLLQAMINGMRIRVNPALGEKLGPAVMNEYEKAKKLNAENPRVWLVLGESLNYMPEEAGGGKKKAKEYLNTAIAKYANDKHDDPAWPSWGLDRAKQLLADLEKSK
jgi:hypothetical protein